jgi:asparagine synthase (glutamine-hydrolysing)
MCGIAGIVDWGGAFGRERLAEIVVAMRDTMVHRGPDDAGVWVDEAGVCALAHRRLSIIDLSAEGRQPIGNEDGSVQVTFNGEIYNFQAIRERLLAAGHSFRSRTDSEVLPHLFEAMDPGRLGDLDGMFAFGVWHRERRRLLLARDPFGKKPLYYAEGPGWFAFASELHALALVPGFDAAIDRDALALYLLLQYVPAPRTIFCGAKKLAAGAYLEADFASGKNGEPRTGRFFEFEAGEGARGGKGRFEERVEELKALVVEAVRKRLVSDVPLGAFLSGGVDSSLVVATIARELGRPVRTFSIGFAGTEETEHVFAREVARHLGTEHHEQILEPDAVELVQEIAARLDEPNGDSSCLPTFLLSRYTRQFVTVALSGDGGDEMFGGYGRYRDTLAESRDWKARIKGSLKNRRWYTPADGYLSPRWLIFQPDEVAGLMDGLPDAARELHAGWRRRLNDGRRRLIHRMRALDVETYLPGAVLAKVDRMSMQVSLEVRCPLLDREVARFARTVGAEECWQPPEGTKRILKRLASQYLPAEWMNRKKMGFGLPASAWSREAMLGLAVDALTGRASELAGLVDRKALAALIERQARPGFFSIYQVWPLLILELWLRKAAGAGQGRKAGGQLIGGSRPMLPGLYGPGSRV